MIGIAERAARCDERALMNGMGWNAACAAGAAWSARAQRRPWWLQVGRVVIRGGEGDRVVSWRQRRCSPAGAEASLRNAGGQHDGDKPENTRARDARERSNRRHEPPRRGSGVRGLGQKGRQRIADRAHHASFLPGMSDISDSACHPRFVTGAWRGGTFNPRRGHHPRASMRKRARPSISRRRLEKFVR